MMRDMATQYKDPTHVDDTYESSTDDEVSEERERLKVTSAEIIIAKLKHVFHFLYLKKFDIKNFRPL